MVQGNDRNKFKLIVTADEDVVVLLYCRYLNSGWTPSVRVDVGLHDGKESRLWDSEATAEVINFWSQMEDILRVQRDTRFDQVRMRSLDLLAIAVCGGTDDPEKLPPGT